MLSYFLWWGRKDLSHLRLRKHSPGRMRKAQVRKTQTATGCSRLSVQALSDNMYSKSPPYGELVESMVGTKGLEPSCLFGH